MLIKNYSGSPPAKVNARFICFAALKTSQKVLLTEASSLGDSPSCCSCCSGRGGGERGGGVLEAVLHWPLLIFLIKPWLELFSSSSLKTFVTYSSCPQLLRGHWREEGDTRAKENRERRLQTGRATAIGTRVDRCPCVNIYMFAKVRAQHLLP